VQPRAAGRIGFVRAEAGRHQDASPVGASFLFYGLFLLVIDLASVGLVLVSWCFFVLLICLVLVSLLL
jgi:hypothetical protein